MIILRGISMKNHGRFKTAGIGVVLFSFIVALLVNFNFEKNYKPGDYIPEENAYFVEKIDDATDLMKAEPAVIPTDDKYNSQKTRSLGSDLIGNIESVWDSYTGEGTTVAIIDDGFDYDHPEYERSDGTSAILSTSRYYYASGSSAYYQNYSDNPNAIKEDWESEYGEWATHGTNTSTTAAAPMGNNGGVGIAPGADILALKIDFTFVAIKAAIQYAIAQDVDVINMSLGAYGEEFIDAFGDQQYGDSSIANYLQTVCQQAYNAGIIVIAAAGNEGTYRKSYPACNYGVIGVGAIGDYDNKGNADALAEFTNYVSASQSGEINVDILAPGYVYTATQGGNDSSSHTHTYSDTQGTSFSSPIVAGAACLWKQKNPSGTPAQFLEQLQSSADGIGYYTNKMIPVSNWDPSLSNVGPSNITNGRLNVAQLMNIDEPSVTTVQSNLNIAVGEKRQITLSSSNGTITYASNNTSVATVSSTGLVEGKAAGNATITVTATIDDQTAIATVGVSVAAAVASTSLSFSPNTVTLNVGDTYDAESHIVTTPSNASRIFLFDTSDAVVASVNEDTGLVTANAVGTATIEAIAIHGDGYDTLTVTVETPPTPVGYSLLTNASQLAVGDSLIFAHTSSSSTAGALAGTYLDRVTDATFSGNTITNPGNSLIFTLGGSSNNWTFTNSGQTLKSSAAKNVNFANGTATWSISIAATGDATITNTTSSYGSLQYNTSSPRFTTYTSSQGAIQIYRQGGGQSSVDVTGVSLNTNTLNLTVGDNSTLTATVAPSDATNKSVSWASNNSSVASVSGGVVTANAVGSATITVTTADGGFTATCSVSVTAPEKTLSSISVSGYKASFQVGESFSFGGTVTATYSDSSTSNVTSSASFGGYDMNSAGTQTVTVSYTYGSITKTTSYQIIVTSQGGGSTGTGTYTIGWGDATGETGTYSNFSATSGTATGFLSFTTTQNNGTNPPAYSSSSKELRLYYASNGSGNGCSITITPLDGIIYTGFTITAAASYTPTVKYSVNGGSSSSIGASGTTYSVSDLNITSSLTIQNGNTTNTQLRIKTIELTYGVEDTSDKIVQSLSASYSGGNVFVGGSLDDSKVNVTAHYTDSTKYPSESLTNSDYSLSGFSSTIAGNKIVTVSYTGALATASSPLTTTFSVNVITDTVIDVTVSNNKTYHPGETIAKGDITVTLHYQSGGSGTTSDFTFASDGYQFTYQDASSGGSNTSKQFFITYGGNSYNFSVNISRVAYEVVSGTTTNYGATEFINSTVSKNSGTPSSTSVTIGSTNYTVTTNAYVFENTWLSFGKTAGSINNTEAFSSDLTSVSFATRSGARLDGVITISKDGNNWVTYSAGELANGGYRYFKVAYTSDSSSYSNISSISFTLAGEDNAINVANYIMYEDTDGQCTTKLDLAIDKLNSMSETEKNTFWTSSDYVIATARERLLAWARHEGQELSYSDGIYQTSITRSVSSISDQKNNYLIIIIISMLDLTAIGGFFFLKRKKEN